MYLKLHTCVFGDSAESPILMMIVCYAVGPVAVSGEHFFSRKTIVSRNIDTYFWRLETPNPN
jgi:hypothetical protein